ncbi:MAG: restriction endonuclease subunit S [Candidatus Gastranaerophilales bacterium]|nr:restriction endonuclease subunit S [Candidatus Gastranaerophilales bacterium]
MKAETLKKSILQYAMQGKLVLQDPNDEPACELLKRIKAEKEQLIKDGKIKKEKPLPPITDDEKPFGLPQGWEWERLGNVGYTNIGLTYKPTDITTLDNGIPVLRSSNIQNNKIDLNDLVRVTADIKNESLYVQKDDILICARNGSKNLVGKSAIIKDLDEPMTFGTFMAIFRSCINSWIKLYLDSPLFRATLESVNTVTINQITQNNLKNAIVPIPPLMEQKRIVEKLEEILPLIDEYGKNKEILSEMNQKLPKQIRQSILQHAVQGKLVPQDPNDEPASELLKRIKSEKEQQIKDGKIKREKTFQSITNNEVPYKLPKGWKFVRLSDVAIFENGDRSSNYPTEDEYVANGIPFWGAKDIINNKLQVNSELRFISKSKFDELRSGKLNDKDFICLLRGSVGKWAEFTITDEWTTGFINAQMVIIRLLNLCLSSWFKVYLNSSLFIEQVSKVTTGSAVAQMSTKDLMNFIIPLPPLAEQKRIVAKVEDLMKLIDKIEYKEA